MPRLTNRCFFYSNSVRNRKSSVNPLLSKICRLDKLSCEGINYLIPFLEGISPSEFESIVGTLLKKCFYINRSFSDAVDFLSIWLVKSPETLLPKLKKSELKEFFCKTEYDKDGDDWPLSKLLHAFLPFLNKKKLTPDKVMSYLFNNFCFLDTPDIFIRMIIGYDQLEQRLAQIHELFHEALLKKMAYIYRKGINLGYRSNALVRFYSPRSLSLQEQTQDRITAGVFLNNCKQDDKSELKSLASSHPHKLKIT
ncbi:MAG: hypothetical protein V4471_04745 [Pseudomonadota bacterium]